MAHDGGEHEFRTVRTMRGTESRTIEKWVAGGWELVGEDKQLLRTQLHFRRPVHKQAPWKWGVLVGALLIIGAIVGGMAYLERSGRLGAEQSPLPVDTTLTTPMPSASPTGAPSEAPTGPPSASLTTTPSESALVPRPLWTKSDGERTIRCMADQGVQEVRFALPARSPISKELNSILHQFDGRAPLTVLTVKEIDHEISKLDETDYLRTLHLETADGDLALDTNAADAASVLDETGLTGLASNAGTKKLRDRAWALMARMNEDDLQYTTYLVTDRPLKQVSAARAEFKVMGPECVAQ